VPVRGRAEQPPAGEADDGRAASPCGAARARRQKTDPHRQKDAFSILKMAASSPIVFDSGSGIMKAGRCGQELPEVVFPSCVGRPKHHRVMASALEAEALMGSDVQKHRGVCTLKYPCQRGIVQDWEDMQRVWAQAFRELRVQPEEHAVLFTESPVVSPSQVNFDTCCASA
jgi:hypothetical protein